MTYTLRKSTVDPSDTVAFDRPKSGITPERHTITLGTFGNYMTGNGVAPEFVPPNYISDHAVISIVGNNLNFRGLDIFETFLSGWLTGATIENRRVVNGNLVEIAEQPVISAIVRPPARFFHEDGNGKATTDEKYIASESTAAGGVFRVAFPGYTKPLAPIYFFVAEKTADGRISAFSAAMASAISASPSKPDNPTDLDPTPVGYFVNDVISRPAKRSAVIDAALTVPTGATLATERGGNTFVVTVPNVAGKEYVVAYSFESNPIEISQVTVADASLINLTDMVLIRKVFGSDTVKADVLSPRVWTASSPGNSFGVRGLAKFNDDVDWGNFQFIDDVDGRYLRVTVDAGKSTKLNMATHSGTGQSGSYYPVPKVGFDYSIRTEMRAVGSTTDIQMVMQDAATIPAMSLTTNFAPYEGVFQVPTLLTFSNPRSSGVTLTGPCVVDVRSINFGEAATLPLMLTDEDAIKMANGQPEYARFHSGVKTRPFSYSVRDYLSYYGTRATNFNSLPQSLRALKAVNEKGATLGNLPISPWAQIPWHFKVADYAAIMEYYSTPFVIGTDTQAAKPWAYLRAVIHGQVIPWSDVFPNGRFEVENENWNGLDGFYNLPSVSGLNTGEVNGKCLDRMAEAFMAVPSYNAAKTNYYLGLWVNGAIWNPGSLANSVHADFAGYADYNGGWDSGLSSAVSSSSPVGYQSSVAQSYVPRSGRVRLDNVTSLVAACAATSEGRAKPIKAAHYESGPGYVLNGLNGATVTQEQADSQQEVMNSLGVGTATLQAFTFNASRGLMSNNFFTFAEGDTWKSHAVSAVGAAAYPSWQWIEFYNQNLIGETSEMDVDIVARMSAEGFVGKSGVQVFSVVNDYKWVIMCSMDVYNSYDVKVKLGFLPTGPVLRYHMPGTFASLNRSLATKDDLDIISQAMPANFAQDRQIVHTLAPGLASVFRLPK